jgi:hypothetical protein
MSGFSSLPLKLVLAEPTFDESYEWGERAARRCETARSARTVEIQR